MTAEAAEELRQEGSEELVQQLEDIQVCSVLRVCHVPCRCVGWGLGAPRQSRTPSG